MKQFDLFICEWWHWLLNWKHDPWAVGTKTTERDLNIRYADTIWTMMQWKAKLVQGVGITDALLTKKIDYIKTVVSVNEINKDNVYGICVHQNASTDKKAKGFEVWYQSNNPKSKEVAQEIIEAYKRYFPENKIRWIFASKTNRLWGLYIDNLPWTFILTEWGFISNPEEQDFLINNVDRLSECICNGLMTYIRK